MSYAHGRAALLLLQLFLFLLIAAAVEVENEQLTSAVRSRKRLEASTTDRETPPVRKFVKLIFGLMLLPLCFGTGSAVLRMLRTSGGADTTWVPLVAGAVCWAVVYLLLPRPMWLYVVGHELTHVVWTWLFGGRVSKMKVSSKGGHVVVSKTNFLIALAPYFFPFYAVLVVGVFLMGRLAVTWSRLEVWFLLLLGAAYAFHLTLTGHVLKSHQSDITEHGYVFSAVIIFLGNALVLVLAIPLLTSQPTVPTALTWCWEGTLHLVGFIQGWTS